MKCEECNNKFGYITFDGLMKLKDEIYPAVDDRFHLVIGLCKECKLMLDENGEFNFKTKARPPRRKELLKCINCRGSSTQSFCSTDCFNKWHRRYYSISEGMLYNLFRK